MSTNKPRPTSINELLKKKKEDVERQKAPVFYSKAQRERLAKQRADTKIKPNITAHSKRSSFAAPKIQSPIQQSILPSSNQSSKKHPESKVFTDSHRKFKFDWNHTEDTLDSNDPLYATSKQTTREKELQEEVKKRESSLKNQLQITNKRPRLEFDDIHWSDKPLDKMGERDWRIFREDFSIVTKGGNIPSPIRFWSESDIPRELLAVVQQLGYKAPTPIQRAAIPIALSHRDVIGIAETGSGKTASFVIPLLASIMKFPSLNQISKNDGPYAIILAPTRELAQQIEMETSKFCNPLGFRCTSIVGGHSIEEQVHNLNQGAEIVIATPGRLLDILERRAIVLSQCSYVVMDEADRMIDLGFEEQVNGILNALPKISDEAASESIQKHTKRQTMMYTATWPRAIQRMAEKYLQSPGTVIIGSAGQATDHVEQRTEFISTEEKKMQRLLSILNRGSFQPPIIIFLNLKQSCENLAKELNRNGWKAAVMHGSKSQDQREAALAQLRSGTADCLVATDIAGRGIDVPDVSLVVNFQMAKSIEDYTHRIGRTGRAGKSGVAISFLNPDDDDAVIGPLKQLIEKSKVSKMSEDLRRYESKNFVAALT